MEEFYETLDELEKKLREELKKMAKKPDISPVEVDNANKAMCLITKIREFEDADSGYSNGAYSRNSYTRRSPRTGRYVSYDEGDAYGRRMQMANRGYSGHSINDRMIDKLESMMDETGSEYERQTIGEWINRLSHGNM